MSRNDSSDWMGCGERKEGRTLLGFTHLLGVFPTAWHHICRSILCNRSPFVITARSSIVVFHVVGCIDFFGFCSHSLKKFLWYFYILYFFQMKCLTQCKCKMCGQYVYFVRGAAIIVVKDAWIMTELCHWLCIFE